MKKKQFTIAAILSASLLLSACGAASSEPSVTTQPIASTQAQAASASQETSVAVQQPSSTAQTAPAQGESVAISTEGQTAAETSLSEEEAKQIAFDHAGVQEADVTGLRIGLDYDDGVRKYDVEFYSGNKEYDYEIDAATGNILGYDNETEYLSSGGQQVSSNQNAPEAVYTEEEAIQIALEQVPGATEDNVTQFKFDYDDGRAIYEIEIRYNYSECDIEIDATTGQILKLEFDD